MKGKIFIVLILILSAFVFISASPWEGAAATAPEGVLPATGMFVATNSFPINTVVDITNIETNKSTRVIVAKGLDSPGLLAVVSRDAAELIGMRQGSVSRVRMVQPGDPIAYLRFIEGQARGIPGYDSGNVIREPSSEHRSAGSLTDSREDAYEPPLTEPVLSTDTTPVTSGITGPSYVLEDEWRNRRENIVNVGEEIVQAEPIAEKPEGETESITEIIEEEPEYIAEEIEEYEEYEEEPEYIAEEIEEYEEEPEYIAEEIEEYEEEPEYIAEVIEEVEEEVAEYTMVPAEERPPEYIYGIDPKDIIPEIITEVPVQPTPAPITELPPARSSTDASFSVRSLTQLDRGSYYVQIAAMDSPESVQNTLNKIDIAYKPVVYSNGDSFYRILLGPMNQGESAAVLARFKSIGYRDAFVRHAR